LHSVHFVFIITRIIVIALRAWPLNIASVVVALPSFVLASPAVVMEAAVPSWLDIG